MSKVVSLDDYRAARANGWAVLLVVCAACGHRHVGVMPNTGAFDAIECASCGKPRGRAVSEAEFDDAAPEIA